jgi:hypothetical protein
MVYTRAAVAALLVAAAVAADDKAKPPAERLEAIKKEQKTAEQEFYKAIGPLPQTAEGEKKYQELYKAYDKGQADRFAAAVEIAKADPKSDVGLAALEWVLTTPRAYYLPAGKPALELTAEHHAANPKVGKLVAWVGYYLRDERAETYPAAQSLLKAVAEKNPDKAARGQAHLSFALQAKMKADRAEYQKGADADKLAEEAAKAFEALRKDYGDSPRLIRENSGTIGELATQELFELRNLRIGKVAPDIDGEDLDGAKFKLSDYRGKVVVLDFWGDW